MLYWPNENLTGLFKHEYTEIVKSFNGKTYRLVDLWFDVWVDYVTWQMEYYVTTGKIG